MTALWYYVWHWLCARSYFDRITVLHSERLPAGGPVLYVCLHRNGAVDGFIYRRVLPRGVFLISTQLLRSFFARLFFCGIAVARGKDDGDHSQNDAALRRCVQLLANGGELVVFPEGTSALGPRHLPFKSGAARIALEALARGVPLRIVPLGIHYERAWAFRSRVEVVVGEPISRELPADLSELGRLKEMRRRMTTALESVGANFPSAAAQANAERFAYAATLGTSRNYFDALKPLEVGVPEPLRARWQELESKLVANRMPLHQGVPLFPVGPWLRYALLLLALGPVVLAGAALNLPPLVAGWLAARKFADDRNVIALWRIMVGLPLFLIWFSVIAILLAFGAGWIWSLGYVLLSLAALKSLYRTKKLAVAVWNGLAHPSLARPAHEFHRSLLRHFSPETGDTARAPNPALVPLRCGTSGCGPGEGMGASKLLPHEWCFGGFLLIHWLRLVRAVGPLDFDALLYFALLLANLLVIAWCRRKETNLRWQLRLWFYPVAMNAVFFTMGSAVLKVTPHKFDAALDGFDRALFGATLSLRAQAIATPALTELLSFCYLLFFPYLIVSWFYYARRGLPLLRQLMVGLFTIYGLGFLGYSFVPASGPHLALRDEFTVPLTGWVITKLNAGIVARGSNGVDVFPSLHCAISTFLLFFDRQHARWRYRLYLAPCIGLWLATIYLRYHYFVDVVLGFALAGFALAITNRWERTVRR